MLIILIRTLILPIKTRKSLVNQGFSIKNKHRFHDTLSYHNYGAFWSECNIHHRWNKIRYAEHTSKTGIWPKEKRCSPSPRQTSFLVGMTGFEPATSCSQSTRATNCATSRSIKFWYGRNDRIRRLACGLGHLGIWQSLTVIQHPRFRFATFDIVLPKHARYQLRYIPENIHTLCDDIHTAYDDIHTAYDDMHGFAVIKGKGTDFSVPWCSCGESNSGHLD